MKLVSSFKTFSPFAKCVPMGIGDWHENLGQNMLMSIERKTLNFLDEKQNKNLGKIKLQCCDTNEQNKTSIIC